MEALTVCEDALGGGGCQRLERLGSGTSCPKKTGSKGKSAGVPCTPPRWGVRSWL